MSSAITWICVGMRSWLAWAKVAGVWAQKSATLRPMFVWIVSANWRNDISCAESPSVKTFSTYSMSVSEYTCETGKETGGEREVSGVEGACGPVPGSVVHSVRTHRGGVGMDGGWAWPAVQPVGPAEGWRAMRESEGPVRRTDDTAVAHLSEGAVELLQVICAKGLPLGVEEAKCVLKVLNHLNGEALRLERRELGRVRRRGSWACSVARVGSGFG